MKFRNKETGEIFNHYSFEFCKENDGNCPNCPIFSKLPKISGHVSTKCNKWIVDHPKEAAELMGYELVEEPEQQEETVVAGLKDTGNRTPMGDTGFVRDNHNGKGRMDLLPWNAIIELSKHCENGAMKYGERNIDKGAPLHSLLDSGARHLAKFMAGYTDEDHLRAALWNIAWALEQKTTHPELNDTPWEYFKKDGE